MWMCYCSDIGSMVDVDICSPAQRQSLPTILLAALTSVDINDHFSALHLDLAIICLTSVVLV